jgi:RNA polymerase sigma factor (sigma-70 family)
VEEETDAQLVAHARADDAHAFRCLVERYQLMAFYLALRLVGQEEIAHELVQEALLQAYLSLDRLRDAARFKSWLYGIVLNLCRNWRRLHPANELSLDEEVPLFEHPLSVDPQALAEERELKQAVRSAIGILTPKNQAVAFLFYYEDLSIQEIASLLAISLSAVKNRLHKGRQQLQAHLQALYPDIVHPSSRERKRKAMLRLQLVKVVHRRHEFYSDTLIPLLLHKRLKRVWVPILNEQVQWRFPKQDTAITEPDTTDFLVQMIGALQGKVEEVAIEALYEDVLYARVALRGQHGRHALKARVGDALLLAIREQSPISVAKAVFDRLAIALADYGQTQEQQLAALEQLAEWSPHLLQSRQAPDNLDFSQGLRGWTLYHGSSALDTHSTHSGKPTLALTLQRELTPFIVFLTCNVFRADAYRGKRVRATAYLKAHGLQQPVFAMMLEPFTLPVGISSEPDSRISSATTTRTVQIVDRHAWTPHVLVMDIPQDAHSLSFSFSMRGLGKGTIWLDGIQLETVDDSVPLTDTLIDDPHPS